MPSVRATLLSFGLIAMGFAAGAYSHKAGLLRIRPIVGWAQRTLSLGKNSGPAPRESVAAQSVRDLPSGVKSTSVDTALLPLKQHVVRLSEQVEFPKGAGGLAIVGRSIVVVDRLGGLHAWADNTLKKLPFPALPNNLEAFLAQGGTPLTSGNFRVHDVEFVATPPSLVVAHENYDVSAGRPRLTVSKIPINPATLEPNGAWSIIFQADPLDIRKLGVYPGLAAGGRLQFQAPGTIYLTIGDYNQDGVMHQVPRVAQDPARSFGKIVAIDLATGENRQISRGHRNPQGLVIDQSGAILATEHGPAGGDELNVIVPGSNYGWPSVTLGVDYGAYTWPLSEKTGEHPGFSPPIYAWLPSIGVCNLIQLKGFSPRWDGDILVASLKARSLFRLRLKDLRVLYAEPIWIGERIRDLAQLENGNIVLWTDDAQLIFLSVDQEKLSANKRDLDISLPPVMAMCMGCHHFGPTNPSHPAPSFTGLIGRPIASDTFARYSPGLKSKTGVWTQESLRNFIADPTAFASGSSMPKPELRPQDLDAILSVLTAPER